MQLIINCATTKMHPIIFSSCAAVFFENFSHLHPHQTVDYKSSAGRTILEKGLPNPILFRNVIEGKRDVFGL